MTHTLRDALSSRPDVAADPLLRELAVVLTSPTGRSSAGWPYLSGHAWARFRDWVPHTLAAGHAAWRGVARIESLAAQHGGPAGPGEVAPAASVVRQVLRTAAVTAPPELWLLRQVLSSLDRAGLLDRWRQGELVSLDDVARPAELLPDLQLLLARGLVGRAGTAWRWLELPPAQAVLRDLRPLPARWPSDLSRRWAQALRGSTEDLDLLHAVLADLPAPEPQLTPAWMSQPADLELGWRLVPLVLGLRASRREAALTASDRVTPSDLTPLPQPLAERVVALLDRCGVVERAGALTALGRRVLHRGPGPFGIIEAYHPYLARLDRIWAEGRGAVHVVRGANVAASQDANRRTFVKANDALDAFCADTGFSYTVFIEHAVGRGEATRQRHGRAGDALTYIGADLEDAAIDAAEVEQAAGRLPASMRFVRQADIGRPHILVSQLRAWGIAPEGAVMLVGNGFHEVRDQTDAHMVEVFAGYERAGIVLLFTEESALSVDDLLETAWNTYHGAFKYVHERSGQVLRPANPALPSPLGAPLPASWTECAQRAGYVRAAAFSSRSRTVHPYPPASGDNPSISVNHFFVPARIAAALELAAPAPGALDA